MTEFVLNGTRIYRLCSEQHLSQAKLGALLGSSGQRITRLLGGGEANGLTLRELSRMGTALGVDPLSLLVVKAPESETTSHGVADAVKVHAVLGRQQTSVHRQEIARVLGWELRRTNAALDALGQMLEQTGEVLHQVNASVFQLRARDEALTDEERQRADRVNLHRTGLNIRSARLLLRLVEAGGQMSTHNTGRLSEVSPLLKHGLAHLSADAKVTLSADVAFSLGLDD